MATRTIPAAFPRIRTQEAFTRKLARADLFRRIAKAQNYLWANIRRTYSNWAHEGNGDTLEAGTMANDPYLEVDPSVAGGTDPTCLCVSSFLVPPNWGPSQRLKINLRWVFSQGTSPAGGGDARIILGVYSTTGVYKGILATTPLRSSSGTYDEEVELETPNDETVMVRVLLNGTLMVADEEGVGDSMQIKYLSARYDVANDDELGGTVPGSWIPHANPAAADSPLSSGLLVHLINNTNALYAYRNPEICQTWFPDPWNNTSSFVEVGRYTIFLPPKVGEVSGRLFVNCTDGGAGNEVRVLVDGAVAQTWTALSAGENELDLTDSNFSSLSDNDEHVITIEAKSTAGAGGGGDWGTMVWGVQVWEEDTTLGLPGGTSVPAAYQPLDESKIFGDKEIVYDTLEGERAGLLRLLENDIWLAANRLRGLIGDWRHRVYKRFDQQSASSDNVWGVWDWTPGVLEAERCMGKPRNITVMAGVDDSAGWTTPGDDRDGYGNYPIGYSDQASSNGDYVSWATVQSYAVHGARVLRFRIPIPVSGVDVFQNDPNGRVAMSVRANRAQPALMYQNDGEGPAIEEIYFEDRGYLLAETNEPIRFEVKSAGGVHDYEPQWFGPKSSTHVGGSDLDVNVNAHCPTSNALTPDPFEGTLFEMEVRGAFVVDEPLPEESLALLS